MNKDETEKKVIPERIVTLIACVILLGALVLYTLFRLLPADVPDSAKPTKTPAATPIVDESGTPLPIDCYVPEISGTSIIFVSSDGKSLLIDAGYAADASAVVDALRTLGITRLDLAFLTTPEEYAVGGMSEVLSAIPAENFYVSAHVTNDGNVSVLCNTLSEVGTNVHAVNADFVSTVEWAENAEVRILSPYNAVYSEREDNTLVLRLAYGESRVTVLGNAGALAERMMVKALPNRLLKTDVIFLTDTGRTEAPYEKYFKVSHADTCVIKRYCDEDTPLARFLDIKGFAAPDPGKGLHLALDGAGVQVVE